MKAKSISAPTQSSNILRLALIVMVLLSIPLIAMQFTDDVNWTASDFVVMGTLLFATGLVYELGIKRVRNKDRRFYVTIGLILGFTYIWAELAVGIFTNWGS